MINSILGASIYGLPSRVYSLTGAYSVLVLVVCAIMIAFIMICFAEVSSRFTETGGQYLYARKAFGPIAGFEIGWLMWLQRLTSFAAVCNILVITAGYFWPVVNEGWGRVFFITAVVIFLTVVNIIGIRNTTLVSNIITIGKLIPVIIFVLAGLFFIDRQNFYFERLPTISDFWLSALLFISVFSGFEAVAIPAGEIRDPTRNLPFAMFVALAVLTILYIFIQVICIGTLPGLAFSSRPITDASTSFMGSAGAFMISTGALIGITGTLTVIMLSGTRILFAIAEQGQFPAFLSSIHPRFRTPYISILISACVMLAVTISGTFIYFLTINVIIRVINYAVTCIALPVLRKKKEQNPVFRAPGGIAVSIISTAFCILLISASGWREIMHVGIAAFIGLPLYYSYRFSQHNSRNKDPRSDSLNIK